jgi:hypothetical protein
MQTRKESASQTRMDDARAHAENLVRPDLKESIRASLPME